MVADNPFGIANTDINEKKVIKMVFFTSVASMRGPFSQRIQAFGRPIAIVPKLMRKINMLYQRTCTHRENTLLPSIPISLVKK